jgi:hypothetical protein
LIIGGTFVSFGDVEAFDIVETRERDWEGQLICTTLYGVAAALVLSAICLALLDLRFLIAVAFLSAVALLSLGDVLGTPAVSLFRLEMLLRDGRTIGFLDADEDVVSVLGGRIAAAGGRRL